MATFICAISNEVSILGLDFWILYQKDETSCALIYLSSTNGSYDFMLGAFVYFCWSRFIHNDVFSGLLGVADVKIIPLTKQTTLIEYEAFTYYSTSNKTAVFRLSNFTRSLEYHC